MSEPAWGFANGIADLAIRRYTEEVGDPYRVDHTVQVTSFGGAGTTALVDHLEAAGVDLQKGPAQWPFKHRRWPPGADEVPAGFRVVYLLGDPRDAVLSIFRRDLQLGHYAALHDTPPSDEAAAALHDIGTFLDNGVDLFALDDHVTRWLRHPPGYPVLFAHHPHLSSTWPELAAFVGLQADVAALPIRERRSDWRSAPVRIRARLDELYGELAARIEALAPMHLA